jgi:hypothetical protein
VVDDVVAEISRRTVHSTYPQDGRRA